MDYGVEEIEDIHPLICPLCEVHELDPCGRDSTLCPHFGGVFLESLHQVSALPAAIGAHACECGHPEIRRLPPRGCSTARPSGGTELGLRRSTILHRELSKRHTEGEGDGKRLSGAQALGNGTGHHWGPRRRLRRHWDDLRYDRGGHLRASYSYPLDRWPSSRAFRQLADRSGAGFESSRRRRRVRPGPAGQGQVKVGNPCRATSRPSSRQDYVRSAVQPSLLARRTTCSSLRKRCITPSKRKRQTCGHGG